MAGVCGYWRHKKKCNDVMTHTPLEPLRIKLPRVYKAMTNLKRTDHL